MDKNSKEKIKELKSQGKYDEIYVQFGKKAYKTYVPSKIRNQELKKLKREGRYEDIYNKFGKRIYKTILTKAMYNEIKEAKGFFKAVLWRTAKKLGFIGSYSAFMLSTGVAGFIGMGAYAQKEAVKNNAIEFQAEIEDYNNKIEEYANEVKDMKLSDVQTFMKVMDDMWGSIKGYGKPQKDIQGFLELDLATEDGQGVCRNMASDVAKKLNKINPEYNARTMFVTIGEDGCFFVADIKRNIVDDNETVKDNEDDKGEQQEESNEFINKISKYTGNHMVTFVDVKEDNITLVLDPTNPSIGIYKDGKITMFNSGKVDIVKYEARELPTAVISRGEGFEGFKNIGSDYIKSFEKANLTQKEIGIKYGLDAQNKALQIVRNMKEKNENKNFKESLKFEEFNTDNQNKEEVQISNNDQYTKVVEEIEK